MTTRNPALGDVVHYRLSTDDATRINHARTGAVPIWQGNPARFGDVYPAIVVRVWAPGGSCNLQVILDGEDTYWATSRSEGGLDGQWSWPGADLPPQLHSQGAAESPAAGQMTSSSAIRAEIHHASTSERVTAAMVLAVIEDERGAMGLRVEADGLDADRQRRLLSAAQALLSGQVATVP